MTDKAAAIHDLELGFQEFRGSLHNVDEERYGETWLGDWNLTQLLAHMSGWFREMTPAFERASATVQAPSGSPSAEEFAPAHS